VRLQPAKAPEIGLEVAGKTDNPRSDIAHRFKSAALARSKVVKADLP
jgi:hypothetical protein